MPHSDWFRSASGTVQEKRRHVAAVHKVGSVWKAVKRAGLQQRGYALRFLRQKHYGRILKRQRTQQEHKTGGILTGAN
jgi:hypothetical protein